VFVLSVVELLTTRTLNKQVFTNMVGTIKSPNYPKNYGNKENRYYTIIAPTKREIVLIFSSFDVEYEKDCAYDYLEVKALV